jgi:hypothetical protein
MARLLGHGLAVAVLTVATQIGGIAYLAALLLRRLVFRPARGRGLALLGLFLLCYAAASFALGLGAVPGTRVALPCWDDGRQPLVMASPLYCALNRHFVTADTARALEALAADMAQRRPGTLTQVLDAGFPLLDGFPLLPHLSHDDGRKADLAFYYKGRAGTYRRGVLASPLGYWAFEKSRPGDPQPCAGGSLFSLRWDMTWFQPLVRDDVRLDQERTKAALAWLTTEGQRHGVTKILLEPHLKARLGLTGDRIRFQGCRAARHDDHIHVESRT